MLKTLVFTSLVLTQLAATAQQNTAQQSRYFIIQNIATEKTRVYERCTVTPGCAHRMVYQTDMLVGRIKSDEMNTNVGTFKISNWIKFYQDYAGKWTSWYDPSYPELPKPGSSALAWGARSIRPNKEAAGRGNFGWYAAILTPSDSKQWIHGTIGWGADGDKFIEKSKEGFANIFADLRSHGCTRVENRAIAYLQNLVPEGSDLYRVYAIENLADTTLSSYETQKNPIPFQYILTKTQVRQKSPNSSSAEVFATLGLSADSIIEKGLYYANQYPTPLSLQKVRASSGLSGNTYKIDVKEFTGVFNVDTGQLINYAHPKSMPIDGVRNSSQFPADVFVHQ